MSNKLPLRKFELDFSKCRYWDEVYGQIIKCLELPDWCGKNLDALWDAATGIMYTPAEITINRMVGASEMQDVVDDIISVLQEAEQEYHKITVIVKEGS